MIWGLLTGAIVVLFNVWLVGKLVRWTRIDTSLEMTEEERARYDRRVAKLPLDDGKPPS